MHLYTRSSILKLPNMIGVHLIVSGFVQGVGFRYFVYKKAAAYGVKGYVKNLYSGDVEIVAVGERGMIESLITDVKIGPRSALVKDVKAKWLDKIDNYPFFEIR